MQGNCIVVLEMPFHQEWTKDIFVNEHLKHSAPDVPDMTGTRNVHLTSFMTTASDRLGRSGGADVCRQSSVDHVSGLEKLTSEFLTNTISCLPSDQ
ncbi:hypothetical protein ACOME3_007790 [Neoechinorhynchus agilis]